jgi:hypothetical protein
MGKNKAAKAASAKALEKIGEGLGVGIIAGLAGTVAITLSQMLEMKIRNRKASTVPADAASKALDIEPKEGKKDQFSQRVHWVYGTSWGIARGLFGAAGLRGWQATALHGAAVLGTAMVIEPALKVAPPINEWSKEDIIMDVVHHAVYAIAAGLVYDAIARED